MITLKKTTGKFSASGVSMLELVLAITIIGLLASVVLSANALKDQLELNQVIEDISKFNTALQEFEQTYGGMAGDLWNAEEKFGSQNASNGDGNSELNTSPNNETLYFWQHLAAAGLIDGTYDGTTNGPGGRPEGSLKNSIYRASTTVWGTSNHGTLYIVASKLNDVGLFTTKQGFDFDAKYDDGDPDTGVIVAKDGTGETAGDCVTGGNYNLTNNATDEVPCILLFFTSRQ